MKARNLLVNKRVAEMTSSDWTALLDLRNEGIQSAPRFVDAGAFILTIPLEGLTFLHEQD